MGINTVYALEESIDALKNAEEKLHELRRTLGYGKNKGDFKRRFYFQVTEMFESAGDDAETLRNALGELQKKKLEKIMEWNER